jgi:hypothetical protein
MAEKALAELIGAAGLEHPRELRPHHLMRRAAADRVVTFAEIYRVLAPSELLSGTADGRFRDAWAMAQAESFAPAKVLVSPALPEAANEAA